MVKFDETHFKLHETLERDLVPIKDLKLCKLMILPNSENPWAVLIPKRDGIKEFFELSRTDQAELMEEISKVSKFMSEAFSADKMNVGALGNMVPQLHIHIICRYKSDTAWPNALWGVKLKKDKDKIEQYKELLVQIER